MRFFGSCLLIAVILHVGTLDLQAQPDKSVELMLQNTVTPEVGPYHSKIRSTHRVLELLVRQDRPLQPSQAETIQNVSAQIQKMKANLEANKSERVYLRHLIRPMGRVIKLLGDANQQLNGGNASASMRLLKQAHQIVDHLYRKPVVQFIVAEQKVGAGVQYMIDNKYEEAVAVFDSAIDILSAIPMKKTDAYLDDLEAVKSHVLALRRQAREKTIKRPLQTIMADVAASFNEAHDSVFGMWGGDLDIKKLR